MNQTVKQVVLGAAVVVIWVLVGKQVKERSAEKINYQSSNQAEIYRAGPVDLFTLKLGYGNSFEVIPPAKNKLDKIQPLIESTFDQNFFEEELNIGQEYPKYLGFVQKKNRQQKIILKSSEGLQAYSVGDQLLGLRIRKCTSDSLFVSIVESGLDTFLIRG